MVETRNTEIRYTTSDPKRLINHYTVNRVLRSWKEDFVDKSNGEIVAIERNEVLLERGTLIDGDVLANIQFHMECGDIKEIEVSNQRRQAEELENTSLRPFMAVVDMSRKKTKFVFYATKIATALLLLKDYIELNFVDRFVLSSIKELEVHKILIDNLKKPDTEGNVTDDEEGDTSNQKKFHQIDVSLEIDGKETGAIYSIIVQTYNIDRGMMLIKDWLIKQEQRKEEEAIKHKREYVKQDIVPMLVSAKPIPIGVFIPREFSEAYQNDWELSDSAATQQLKDAVRNFKETLEDNNITMTVRQV